MEVDIKLVEKRQYERTNTIFDSKYCMRKKEISEIPTDDNKQ